MLISLTVIVTLSFTSGIFNTFCFAYFQITLLGAHIHDYLIVLSHTLCQLESSLLTLGSLRVSYKTTLVIFLLIFLFPLPPLFKTSSWLPSEYLSKMNIQF